MRYKLDETTGPHPWRKRRNPISQALEPAYQMMRGIKDTETREWHTPPKSRAQSQFIEVRALNGLPPLTRQKVQGVLKRAGLHFSETHTTRVAGWYHTTAGVTVWQSEEGEIKVGYTFHHHAKERPYNIVLAPALKALQEAGLNPQQTEDGLITL